MPRIILSTFGSLGDLHPYCAVALALKRRGADPVILTTEHHRERVTKLGLTFAPCRHILAQDFDPEVMAKAMHATDGPRYIIRELIMPALREAHADTTAVSQGADLIVAHPLTHTARTAAELLGVPWVGTVLAPMGFLSAHDPPALPPAPWMRKFAWLGPRFHRRLFGFAKWTLRRWSEPLRELRRELQLPAERGDPMLDGLMRGRATLAMFSETFGRRQPDWPKNVEVTGFPFLDHPGGVLAPELEAFISAGPPPVVFTLGSAAVMSPGRFYAESVGAVKLLGVRAVLLTGDDPANVPPDLPPDVLAWPYAAFSAIFPRSAAVVHQGGIGTTSEGLRAGVPAVVVPFAHDQYDNGDRVRRLGMGEVLARKRYSAKRATRVLEAAMRLSRGSEVGEAIRRETGADAGAEALINLLH